MIERSVYLYQLEKATKRSPIVALLGPRQIGKTKLAQVFANKQDLYDDVTYFDLESLPDQRRLQNPELVLGALPGLVIIDEVQVMPRLFNVLRVLADRQKERTRFLILGSSSPAIVKNVSESLADRVELIELGGFDLREVTPTDWEKLWLVGGYPLAFTADGDEDSMVWRSGFVRTFLERDIPQLGITVPSAAMRRFWTMLAHSHGQRWNANSIGRSMGLTDKTVRSYLELLTGTTMVRQLQPWQADIRKRQVKSPKIFIRDSGLLHNLLDIRGLHNLFAHPMIGPSWEGFVLEQVIQLVRPNQAYFWATHNGAELDLLFAHRGRYFGIEAKLSESPTATRSMRVAIEDLELEHLWVIYPGKHVFSIDEKISVLPLEVISDLAVHIQ